MAVNYANLFYEIRKNKLNESEEVKQIKDVEQVQEAVAEELTETLFEGEVELKRCPDCGDLFENINHCEACGAELLLEAKLVVRDGKIVKLKPKKKIKKKMSAKQKAALAKARKKAHSAGAAKARAKSMKIRKKKLESDDVEELQCPECGTEIEVDLGVTEIICDTCGEVLELVEEACKGKKKNEADNDENLETVFNQVKKGFSSWKSAKVKLFNKGNEIVVTCMKSDCSANIQVDGDTIYFEVFDSGSEDVLYEKIKLKDDKTLLKVIKQAIAIFKEEYEMYFAESQKNESAVEFKQGTEALLEALAVPNRVMKAFHEGEVDIVREYMIKEYNIEV